MPENNPVVEEQQVENNTEQQNQQPTYSAKEQEAMEMGWRPQSEFTGDPDDFVSAKEFVQRKSFYDKISHQSKEIKELKSAIDEYTKHHKNLEEYTRKQILTELKSRKKDALEAGDSDALIEIDEAISDFKLKEKELQEKKEEPAQQQSPEVLMKWKAKNDWFESNRVMTAYANDLAKEYIAKNGKDDPSAVLAYVEKEVKKEFPDKFQNQNRAKPSTVEGSSAGKATNKADKFNLSDEERRVAQRFVRSGLYKSVDDYAKELAKLNKQGE